jgi:hypothetical protein
MLYVSLVIKTSSRICEPSLEPISQKTHRYISGSYLPLIILYTSIMSPLDLLYDNDGSFWRRKRSSYDKSESPGISGQDSLESDSEETELVQDCKRQMIAFYQKRICNL